MNGLEQRLAAIVGATPVAWTPRAGGYSTAERYTVDLDDGRRVFVKAADAEHMARWLGVSTRSTPRCAARSSPN